MTLPNRLFFTGVPGSRWSVIARTIENVDGFNISDRNTSREFHHGKNGAHLGVYFDPGMEFESIVDSHYLDQAWTVPGGTKLIKSHTWAYKLDEIKQTFPNDWIMLVIFKQYYYMHTLISVV